MPATVTLLLAPNIVHELKCAAKQAASAAIRASRPSSTAPDVRTRKRLTEELRSCFEEALSELSSEFNTETTLLGRLSNELWCMVFSFLPMRDLVVATHVCRNWRSVALGNPALWTTIEYTSHLHHDDCSCHLVAAGLVDESQTDCEDGPGSSNLKMVKAALARSGGMLPISLHVEIQQESCSHEDLERLARAVKPYLPRLSTLRICTEDDEAYTEFLGQFKSLPALRTLVVSCSFGNSSSYRLARGTGFLSNPLFGLPALETLELDIPNDVRGRLHAPKTLPALTALRLHFKTPSDILTYLDICPRLRQLVLMPSSPSSHDKALCERVRERVRSVADVQVMDICPDIEHAILAMVDNDALNSLLLDYKSFESTSPHIEGLRILRHLGAVDELSIARRPGPGCEQLVISARSQTGKTRALTFAWQPDAVAFGPSGIWSNISAPPRSLVVDARLWTMLDQSLTQEIASSVRKITVLVSPSFDLSALSRGRVERSQTLTTLQEVEIAGPSWENAPTLSSAALLSLLQWLRGPESVQRLVIRRIKTDEHTVLLKGMACTVVVQ